MLELYRPGHSFLHRLSPGIKLLALAVCGTSLFLIDSLLVVIVFFVSILALFPLCRMPLITAWQQIRPVIWILLILFVAQFFLNGWALAVFVTIRFAALLMMAGLLTLTTRSSDMIDALERILWVTRYVGLNPAKISLALSLALRFIPVLATVTHDVREAQKVRQLERSVLAVAIPVVIRTLRMADDIADAIDARGYDPTLTPTDGRRP